MVVAVDHDLGHAVIAYQGLDRPKLLVVLVDVDTRDPDCHSASLQLANYHGAAIASPTFDRRTPTIHSRARPRPQLRAPIRPVSGRLRRHRGWRLWWRRRRPP